MKTIKYILTAFLLTSFLFACDKSNEIKYTVKGRLMYDCGVPAANVTDVSFKQHGQPLFGQKGMFLSFNTDAEGYFEVVYNRKDANSLDMEILKNGPILEGIPAMKNLDLGEVFWGVPPFNFILSLNVSNAYTNLDTLHYYDWNYPQNGAEHWMKKIPGPFESGVLDTVWNCIYMNSPTYGKDPLMNVSYFINDYQTNKKEITFPLVDLCSDELYEAVIKID